jgi:hypothetical protein
VPAGQGSRGRQGRRRTLAARIEEFGMSLLGIVIIVIALLVAWKVAKLFVRLAMIALVIFGLYLILSPLLGAG